MSLHQLLRNKPSTWTSGRGACTQTDARTLFIGAHCGNAACEHSDSVNITIKPICWTDLSPEKNGLIGELTPPPLVFDSNQHA